MKYKNKDALIADCNQEWDRLWKLIDESAELRTRKVIRSSEQLNKVEWTIPDVLAHLHAWHRLLLQWYKVGLSGEPELPAKGFNWKQLPDLNQILFDEFRDQPVKSIVRKTKLSHNRVMKLVASLSEKKLMLPGAFRWTGKLGLVGYVAPCTAGHYRWAIKKIKSLR